MRIAIEEYLKRYKEAYIFIDEISSINDAWNVLKGLIDSDLMKSSNITLITSNA
ncbi:MAG: AAA family ATPase [Euryarchaeota archaeon]|nr:AAA family ATPase [Euryarchaeota archaeon]